MVPIMGMWRPEDSKCIWVNNQNSTLFCVAECAPRMSAGCHAKPDKGWGSFVTARAISAVWRQAKFMEALPKLSHFSPFVSTLLSNPGPLV